MRRVISILLLAISTSHSTNNQTSDICGLSYADRIVGGSDASLGQYPWIARLGYLIRNRIEFNCDGVLISQRHVLTAAHCVTGLASGVKFYCVDLGENIADNEPDCNDIVCSDPVQRHKFLSVKSHVDYDHPEFKNDIALIKLRSYVQTTQWIMPVCLPFHPVVQSGVAEVAGFGLSKVDSEYHTPNLQTLKVPILDLERCARIFEPTISIDDRQLCVGGKAGQDECAGDSGGPLVKAMSHSRFVGPRYFLIGIVSFGMTQCGKTPTPSIFTNVYAYMPWITNHMD